MTEGKNRFNWRAFTSLYITFSFLIMMVSGIILFLAPAGRIAKWTYISILGMEKESWQAIHVIFTLLFIIATGFHIYYNWKPFLSYLKSKIQKKLGLRKELVASFFVTVAILLLTLYGIPPFSTVLEFGEDYSDSWATDQTEPPVPHAESMSFIELAAAIDKPADELLSNLKEHQIFARDDEIIQDVAEKNNLTPLEMFNLMKAAKQSDPAGSYSGSGLGRKSFREVCETLGLDLGKSLQLLQENGIEVDTNKTLKDISGENDISPVDIMEIINPQKK